MISDFARTTFTNN